MSVDFEALPRLLHEMCDGPHGGWSEAVYAFDAPSGGRLWYCPRCYLDKVARTTETIPSGGEA